MSEDAILVSRIQCGDLPAFEALYDKYKRRIYQTALAISGDSGAAEEILQDTFVRAYGAMDRVDASASLGPWLHRIAVNLSYNWTNRHRHWTVDIELWVDRLLAGPGVSPEREAEGVELRDVVQEALDSLGGKQRTVVVLFYLQGFSLAEIAYILDCPVGTVKSRLHYACKALRQKLTRDSRLVGEVIYGTS
jgi:RNA polymerase sigma-70 factor (ECF subfamily)